LEVITNQTGVLFFGTPGICNKFSKISDFLRQSFLAGYRRKQKMKQDGMNIYQITDCDTNLIMIQIYLLCEYYKKYSVSTKYVQNTLQCTDILIFFCVGVMYSGEYDACDVILSVYPHRASLSNITSIIFT
jgi:hypothetical protein